MQEIREKLRSHSLVQLEEMLSSGNTLGFLGDRKVFLAILVEVIKEKRKVLSDLSIRPL